ncbi:MAG: hypothetical protein Q9M15_01825 [Mariprofundaceae bacterium]|nr:hypothetical protein [Mariprofundaceae bacterium]
MDELKQRIQKFQQWLETASETQREQVFEKLDYTYRNGGVAIGQKFLHHKLDENICQIDSPDFVKYVNAHIMKGLQDIPFFTAYHFDGKKLQARVDKAAKALGQWCDTFEGLDQAAYQADVLTQHGWAKKGYKNTSFNIRVAYTILSAYLPIRGHEIVDTGRNSAYQRTPSLLIQEILHVKKYQVDKALTGIKRLNDS